PASLAVLIGCRRGCFTALRKPCLAPGPFLLMRPTGNAGAFCMIWIWLMTLACRGKTCWYTPAPTAKRGWGRAPTGGVVPPNLKRCFVSPAEFYRLQRLGLSLGEIRYVHHDGGPWYRAYL